MNFKVVLIVLIKSDPTDFQQFEIKYGWREFEIRNNFSYRSFSRFKMEFELKFRQILMS
jgi:hypothetical protein